MKQRGGVELGFGSVTTDKHAAQKDGLRSIAADKRRREAEELDKGDDDDDMSDGDGDAQLASSEAAEAGDDSDDETVYLPLAGVPAPSVASTSAPTEGRSFSDMPVRLLKLTSLTESSMPVDLAAFADADGAAPISATTLLLAKEKKAKKERPKKEKPPKKERPPKAKKEKKPKKEKAAPASAEAAPAEEEQPNPEAEALRAILKETVGQKKY